ncbi:MAG TPA: DUF5715 family protein [Gemmatimonadaceae bacterium]|nr:DUF5715 family protein [Gemmatimonadaceae bacterium]
MHRSVQLGILMGLVAAPALARADGLAGSPSSMVHQHEIAMREDYSFLRTPKQVQALASSGALVQVIENEHLALSKVSYPFTRPEVRDFIERFAVRYHEATGTRLVITSLTRPSALQPRNAHKLSVHPAGMAVDLRVPDDSAGRAYLERSLLDMETAGALDVTREHAPPHYHIAVFAEKYQAYAIRQDSLDAVEHARRAAAAAAAKAAAPVVAQTPARRRERTLPGLAFALLAVVGMTAVVRRDRMFV